MTVARQVALTVAVFAATLFLLLGLTAILRERGGSTAVASPSPSVSAGLSPTIPVSAPP